MKGQIDPDETGAELSSPVVIAKDKSRSGSKPDLLCFYQTSMFTLSKSPVVSLLGAVTKTSHEFTRIFLPPFRENSCNSWQKLLSALERKTIKSPYPRNQSSSLLRIFPELFVIPLVIGLRTRGQVGECPYGEGQPGQ